MTALTIILVEDNDGDALILEELLEDDPRATDRLTFHRATSIAGLIEVLADFQPDCILLDLGLPDASGAEAVSAAVEAAPDVPVVVLTGSDDEELARSALLTGAQDYLVKGSRLTDDGVRRAIRYAIDRSSQTRELRASRLELRDFAHRVAHDLKSPLAILLGAVDLMSTGQSDAGGQEAELRDMLSRSGRRMVDMVDRLLEYAESAGADDAVTEVSIDSVVSWVVATVGEGLDDVEIRIESPLPIVRASETGLRHVFLNLIGNSVKFADPARAPVITIRGSTNGDRATIEVCDNGRGIEPSRRSEAFSLGTRIHLDQPGSGLGLATVKRTVDLSGGTVEVDDGIGGDGTIMRLVLRTGAADPVDR